MKKLLPLALLLATPSTYAFDSVTDLMKHYSGQRIGALLEYIEEHPEAADTLRAYDALIDGYVIQENFKAAIDLLDKKYTKAQQSDPLDMQLLFGEIVPTYTVLALQGGMKTEGKAFIERVLNDFKDHEALSRIEQMLEQWRPEFELPGKGETMDFTFKPINAEKEVSIANLKGKVVLIDFWATWCAPCVQAMPDLSAAYEKYHDKGFEIIGISADQSKNALTSFIEREKLPWPQAFDQELETSLIKTFHVSRFPTTFLLGKDGKIIATRLHGDDLEKQLEKLL